MTPLQDSTKARSERASSRVVYESIATAMTRDDEIYELAKEDRRVFFPGSHASILEAVRVLLADGFSARWEERGETLRNRMGWGVVKDPSGDTFDARTFPEKLRSRARSRSRRRRTSCVPPKNR
jgi:hypothetical protein